MAICWRRPPWPRWALATVFLGLLVLPAAARRQHAPHERRDQNNASGPAKCRFPASEVEPFFFDFSADTPAEFVVLDSPVEPADARLDLVDIRSSNLPNVEFLDYFEVATRPATGRFFLVTTAPLRLPDFPSRVNETLLYLTVACNGRNYPLITVRVGATVNRHAPYFVGEPYEVVVLRNSVIGTQQPTTVMALDRDPADGYAVRFAIESGAHGELGVVSEQRSALDDALLDLLRRESFPSDRASWPMEQLPHILHVRVLSRLSRSVYYLNISAATAEVGSDLIPNQQILAVFPAPADDGAIVYELDRPAGGDGGAAADYFEIDASTARLRVRQSLLAADLPPAVDLQIRAYPAGRPRDAVTATLTLTDVSEVHLTYFAQCRYEAHLLENPSTYTRVMQFNYKGDVDGVELLNGTDLFEVNADGVMLVRFGAKIDREKVERIVVQARLRTSMPTHPKSAELCQTATVEVIIDDFNDHTPRFDAPAYRFYLDLLPYNNTEVGTVRAVDDDKGEFGSVRYRILTNEYESLPFIIFQADGAATIYYTVKTGDATIPDRSYTFTIEAYDSDVDPRTSRVSVHVVLESEAEARERQRAESAQATTSRDNAADFQFDADDDAVMATARRSAAKNIRAHHSKRLEIQEHDVRHSMEIEQTETFEDPEGQTEKTTIATETPTSKRIITTTGTTTTNSVNKPSTKLPSTVFLKQLDLASAAAKNRPHNNKANNNNNKSDNDNSDISPSNDNYTTSSSNDSNKSNVTREGPPESQPKSYSARFESDHYNFSLKGRLELGDYIGVVQLYVPRYDRDATSTAPATAENEVERLLGSAAAAGDTGEAIEYVLEEGILGYVSIDPLTGRLAVDRRLIEDSYEEIRFSVSARNQHGDIVVSDFSLAVMSTKA